MILISIFIQIHSTDNEMSIKKFVYLMINDIERQNNIKKSIESTIKNLCWLLENHKKILSNQQHSSLKTKHFNKWSHYLLLSIVIRSIIKTFIMIWSSVNTQLDLFKNNQSLDSIIYFKLFSHLLKFLRTDFVWKHRQFMPHSQTLDESLKVSIFWDIKNVKQL